MNVTENDNVVCFDVDDTLVIWDIPENRKNEAITFDNFGTAVQLLPHRKHIELLRQFKARGQYVVVWSQGGYEWAREVVKKLDLESLVDCIMTKPKWIIDDLPASVWTKRTYLDLDGNRMKCNDVMDVDFDE